MGIQLKQLADGSAGLEGVNLDAGAFIHINIPYNTTTPLTMSGICPSRRLQVQGIFCVTDVASTNAVTATVFNAANTVALASGAAVHSGTFSLQTTAGTNASLTLSATPSALVVIGGSRVGVVISGALGAAGSGVITIACTPL